MLNDRRKWGSESDPSIDVVLDKETDSPYCITVRVQGYTIRMHARSAVDLQRKLAVAILDYTGWAMDEILKAHRWDTIKQPTGEE